MKKFHKAFAVAVEKLAGAEARRGVEREGLRNVHKYLPANKVALLEHHIKQQIGDDLYSWAQAVGKETIGLAEPFYVDMLIVIRIHYPQTVAREGGASITPPKFAIGARCRRKRRLLP